MNILEAYIQQYGFFNVLFSSVDYELLKEIVLNLGKDFKAEFIDLFPIMINIEDIDNNRIKDLTSTENNVRFIIVPTFPYKYVNLKISFHINISLNYKLISQRNIKKEYVDLENKYKDPDMRGIKYFNLHKYINEINKLENDIFNVLISRINKKLDNGNYIERLKNSEKNEVSTETISNEVSTETISNEITTDTMSNDDFKTDKLVSKKINYDEMEKYLDKKNESIDRDIMNEVSDEVIDPLKDIDNNIELEDVNMDNDIIPTNDFSSMKPFEIYNNDQNGKLINKVISGKRQIHKSFGIFGKRKLNKKMK